MRIIILLMFFIFSYASEDILQNYKIETKLLHINSKFLKMINIINNSNMKTTFELLDSNSKYPMPYILNGYKNSIQTYFSHLKKKTDEIKLILSYNDVKHANKDANDMIIISKIDKDIKYLVQNRLNCKVLYKDIIKIITSEIYLIEIYNIEPNYVIVQKKGQKAYILKTLKEIKQTLQNNYDKNSKP